MPDFKVLKPCNLTKYTPITAAARLPKVEKSVGRGLQSIVSGLNSLGSTLNSIAANTQNSLTSWRDNIRTQIKSADKIAKQEAITDRKDRKRKAFKDKQTKKRRLFQLRNSKEEKAEKKKGKKGDKEGDEEEASPSPRVSSEAGCFGRAPVSIFTSS